MMSVRENIVRIREQLPPETRLVAVSKFHPASAVEEAYACGQRLFGENRPQELAQKAPALPDDIQWHFLGHLQTNKLKMVLPYVAMVESVDSLHLLEAINRWATAAGKVVPVLLELHVAAEETKQGFVEEEALEILFRREDFPGIRFCGLMGMASHTDCEEDIRADFSRISQFFAYVTDLFPELTDFRELSIGMSGDWQFALDYGATLVRIGTAIFGERR